MSVTIAQLLNVAMNSGWQLTDEQLLRISREADSLGDVRRMIEQLATLSADADDAEVDDAYARATGPQPEAPPEPTDQAPSGPVRSGATGPEHRPVDELEQLLRRAVGARHLNF